MGPQVGGIALRGFSIGNPGPQADSGCGEAAD